MDVPIARRYLCGSDESLSKVLSLEEQAGLMAEVVDYSPK